MEQPLRILFIEDNEDDVIIAEETLRRNGLLFQSHSVVMLEEISNAINKFNPDIIVSDYNLPGYTALDALKICREQFPDIPVVVFTGSINEEVAVKCLKQGADDYVLKKHIRALPHTIKEVIEKKRLERERQLFLEQLKISEDRYSYICAVISDYAYTFRVEEDGTLLGEWISDRFYKVFGLTIPEIDARGGWQSIVYPEDLRVALEHANIVLSGKPHVSEFRFVTKSGEIRWLRDYAIPVFDEKRSRVIRIYGASQDITEQRMSEMRFEELARKLEHYLSSSPTITYSLKVTETGLVPVWISENITQITGYDVSETLSPDWWAGNIHPEDREDALKSGTTLLAKRELRHEYRFRVKNGTYKWIHDELRAIRDESGNIIEIIGSWTDITEKKMLEEELNKQRNLLLHIMDISPAGILFVDENRKIIYANKTFCNNIGYSHDEIMGRCIENLRCRFLDVSGEPLPNAELPISRALIRKEEIRFLQFMLEKVDGNRVILSSNASPFFDKSGRLAGAVCITIDITEHKKLEAQYLQAQKLEAIGRLTSGIAHDFNNLLSAILGFSELALMRLKMDPPVKKYFQTIYDAGDKARLLIQQLLVFSRRQIQTLQILNLNDVISDFQKMLSRIIGEDINLIIIKDENISPMKADRTQIEQVIMNLAVNARDAMPNGGKFIIETKMIDVTEVIAKGYFDIKPGRYVMLSVTDTGTGMTDDVKSHLFEPFFTTKDVGKGTGLGLATVYGIVKEHGGDIHVYSEVGKGTTFKIYLPAAEESQQEIKKEELKLAAMRGSETIVVVEDNSLVKNFVEVSLKEYGYTVIGYDNPYDALEFIKTTDKRIDLVITDMVMPDMSGRELEDKVNETKKDIKFLFMSGYTDDTLLARGVLKGNINFINKPFRMDEFIKKVRNVLS